MAYIQCKIVVFVWLVGVLPIISALKRHFLHEEIHKILADFIVLLSDLLDICFEKLPVAAYHLKTKR